jgi:hypothetical protein
MVLRQRRWRRRRRRRSVLRNWTEYIVSLGPSADRLSVLDVLPNSPFRHVLFYPPEWGRTCFVSNRRKVEQLPLTELAYITKSANITARDRLLRRTRKSSWGLSLRLTAESVPSKEEESVLSGHHKMKRRIVRKRKETRERGKGQLLEWCTINTAAGQILPLRRPNRWSCSSEKASLNCGQFWWFREKIP